ncbi:MAG: two-component sensor histidine kinase [Anaerolineaceae bacterium]|nr:MAG: two-component sensor histidine kinase [Anaerolineaceae bacterium]
MDQGTLEFLTTLENAIAGENWKKSLDALFAALRKGFVFDNLSLHVAEKQGGLPEAIYARAVGRGRSAEADASWGEEIAGQVIAAGRWVQDEPPGDVSADRVQRPYLLGLPLSLPAGRGALVFVRFGGPEYAPEQVSLAALAASLVSRVYERRALRENMAQLENARHRAQLQDDFIATVSHDLRTPIGFIKGYTTSLLRPDTTWNKDTQREFLNIIDEETDHLMALIDRLLDSARLQSGMMVMDFQLVRLDALLRDVAQRIAARHPELEVELDLKPAPPIRADSVRLAEVIDNLFDNAIKYAPKSKITIALCRADDYARVTFADHGPGIASKHLPFLFERFYRVPDSLSNRGTGLGLFICREIVRAHGGSITVETAPGKGTVFCIELPVERRKGANS